MVWPFKKKTGVFNDVETLSGQIHRSVNEILDVNHNVIKGCKLILENLKSAVDEVVFLKDGSWGSSSVASFVSNQNLGKFKVKINNLEGPCKQIEVELNKELKINSKIGTLNIGKNKLTRKESASIELIKSGLLDLRDVRMILASIYNYDKLKLLIQKNGKILTDKDGLELHRRLENLHEKVVSLKRTAVQLGRLEKNIGSLSKNSIK